MAFNVHNQLLKMILMLSSFALYACTNEYAPQRGDDGAAIFQAACAECHQPLAESMPDMIFELHKKNTNVNYIEFKIYSGGITMPKFPNIRGKKLKRLADYVLAHNLVK
jgi:mono/diheme cytochrome c family protein